MYVATINIRATMLRLLFCSISASVLLESAYVLYVTSSNKLWSPALWLVIVGSSAKLLSLPCVGSKHNNQQIGVPQHKAARNYQTPISSVIGASQFKTAS